MNIPEELKYTSDHEWILLADGTARVGITDYAQDALGDVVFAEVPSVGAAVERGASIGEVESTKSVSDIYAPLTGTVTEVNELLDAQPGKLNDDPYGEGWMFVLSVTDEAELGELLDAASYRELTGE